MMNESVPVFSETGFLPGAISLLEQLDKRLLVQLRDGKILIGTLRTIDQFANLVLQSCVERIYVEHRYAEIPRGIFMVRGENVVLAGEIDESKEYDLERGLGVPGGPHYATETSQPPAPATKATNQPRPPQPRLPLRRVPMAEILELQKSAAETKQKLADAQTKAIKDRGLMPRTDTMTDDNY